MSSLKSQVRRAIASLTSTPGFGVDPPTVSAAVAMTERYSLSSLLPYKGYDTENDLVVLDCVDELSMGFGFELAPAIIAGTSMEEQLEAVITKLPDDTVMQIGIFFNDDVGHDLTDWETKRVANCKFEVLSEMTRRRAAFMRECAQERSLLPAQLLHVRMARLLVFVRIPFKGDNDSPIELDRWIGSVRQDAAKVGDAFSATGLPARRLDGREHRRIIAQMLNPQFTIEEMDNASSDYKGFPKGLVRKESRIRRRNEDGGIEFTGGSRDTVAVTVTVDSYPIDSYLPNTRQLLGDLFSRTDAIPERFWLWTVIHCPDKNKAREVQQFKLGNITRMTLSESAWFRTMARDLYRRREETQAVLDATGAAPHDRSFDHRHHSVL